MPPKRIQRICFYCNKASRVIEEHAPVRQWDCPKCEATNFYDKNGNITDPPVYLAHDAAPAVVDPKLNPNLKWFNPTETEVSDSYNTFCETCVQNQRILISALREYDELVDESHPDFNQKNQAFMKYRMTLEERYPQVCEGCQPRALEKMRRAGYIAKTDYLRRMLHATRERMNMQPRRLQDILRDLWDNMTWTNSIHFAGRFLFYYALFGQLFWNIVSIFIATQYNYPSETAHFLSHVDYINSNPFITYMANPTINYIKSTFFAACISTVISGLTRFSRGVYLTKLLSWLHVTDIVPFILSIRVLSIASFVSFIAAAVRNPIFPRSVILATWLSVFWNPRFWQANNGFYKHIKGMSKWYRVQRLSLLARTVFYIFMGTSIFSDPFAPQTTCAHFFILFLVSALALKARGAIRVDMTPLWKTAPEQFRFVGPKTQSALEPDEEAWKREQRKEQRRNNLRNARGLVSAQEYRPLTPPSPAPSAQNNYAQNNHALTSSHQYKNTQKAPGSYTSSNSIFDTMPRRSTPSFARMTPAEGRHYIETGEVPAHMQHEFDDLQLAPVEEMDWEPIVPQTSSFMPRPTQPRFQAPEQPSPFYGRLPPAPVMPAHQARNPPNQARLRVPSKEAKESFFQPRMNNDGFQVAPGARHDMEMRKQSFFPPQTTGDEEELLKQLSGVTLGSGSNVAPESDSKCIIS